MERMRREPKNEVCAGMDRKLANLLLDPASAPVKLRAHVEDCSGCGAELAELRATVALLDGWESPRPNPYFMSRLEARMREEREAAPAGFFDRLRARLAYGPPMHVRPLAAMALTVALLVGGGAYLGITDWEQTAPVSGQEAVVHDLQTLDNNAQLLDQLETLSSTNDNGD